VIEQINYKEKLYLLKHNKVPSFLVLNKLMFYDLCAELNVHTLTYYHGLKIKIDNVKDILIEDDKT